MLLAPRLLRQENRRYAPGEGSIPPVLLSGVSKGVPPLAHNLSAKCSVLYLLAWLTETGCGASCAPFAPAGKQAVCSRRGQHTACFWYPWVSKGCPLWHSGFCLAKCSVLYLLAWLTGETGCGASCAPFAPANRQYAPGEGNIPPVLIVRGFQRGAPSQSGVYTCWRG